MSFFKFLYIFKIIFSFIYAFLDLILYLFDNIEHSWSTDASYTFLNFNANIIWLELYALIGFLQFCWF